MSGDGPRNLVFTGRTAVFPTTRTSSTELYTE